VRHLQQQNPELAGRCGYLQAELAAARERILALEAPAEPPASASAPAVGAGVVESAPAPTRPWWRFW
jgi:hypothetical protein